MNVDAEKKIKIALAGNANVGKSALFNYLTGMTQHVANWPGKTIAIAEGMLKFRNYEIKIIDLPGVYSLSTFSLEEQITCEYIIKEKPDVIINVVDSTALERNLFFTTQLIELDVPLVIALNQSDVAKKKDIVIDKKKLSDVLGILVVATVATKGNGVHELIERCIEVIEKKALHAKKITYGKEIEMKIIKLENSLSILKLPYSRRYAAIKLIEGNEEVMKEIDKHVLQNATKYAHEIERIHNESAPIVISNERYTIVCKIIRDVQTLSIQKVGISEKIDEITTHCVFGYIIMLLVLGSVFYTIFTFGDYLSSAISDLFDMFRPSESVINENILWEGLIGGLVAGLTLVIPYVLPFYLLLSLLEDTGYITRIAYLLDGIMRKIGFHGKAIIPLLLGYGCSVPACFACRIMEYDRDRLIAAFAITLVPCTARTVVILALVGTYLGIWWALALYFFNIVIIAILAKIAFKILPGDPVGLIMEMPSYKLPSLSVIAKQTFMRIKSLIIIVFPYYICGGLLLAVLQIFGIIGAIGHIFEPLISNWLGLPVFASTLLIFGIVRKELIVVLPAIMYGATDLSTVFTPAQMIVLTIIAMFYIPCIATIAALSREFGMKKAFFIIVFEIFFTLLLGGIIWRLLIVAGLS